MNPDATHRWQLLGALLAITVVAFGCTLALFWLARGGVQ